MMLTRRIMLAAMTAFAAGRARAVPVQPLQLMMVRSRGCIYCAQWDRDIGPVYAAHPLGRRAPILAIDRDGPYPDGLVLARKPWLTPTFILLQSGQEITRFEGYPGKDAFFDVLRDMLAQTDI